MSRRLALWVLPLLVMLGLGSSPARAVTVILPATTVYDFTGTCTDCSGFGNAELTLASYVPGSAITTANFVSFHYDGTDLLAAYTISAADVSYISGSITGPLPAAENFDLITNGFNAMFESFYSTTGGGWCTGQGCFADYGATSFWSVPSAVVPTSGVPEPLPLALLAGGLVAGYVVRRKRG
jgi:hypothetical protein